MNASKESGTHIDQELFDASLGLEYNFSAIFDTRIQKNEITTLSLKKAPPTTYCLRFLINSLPNLQTLNLSHNLIGPQCFRVIMLAMCYNRTIEALNMSNNMTDTDSAESIGIMLKENKTLIVLDISSNHLGNDYLSRCLAPSLEVNDTLKILRMHSVGATDFSALLAALSAHKTLTHIDLSSNTIKDPVAFAGGLKSCLQNNCLALINIRNCGLNKSALSVIKEGLQQNTTLMHLNAGSNEFAWSDAWMDFFIACITHSTLKFVDLSDAKVTETKPPPAMASHRCPSDIHTLNLSRTGLTNEAIAALADTYKRILLNVHTIYLSDNSITPDCLPNIVRLTSSAEGQSSVKHLYWVSNDATNLVDHVMTFPDLEYLNVRKAQIKTRKVEELLAVLQQKSFSAIVLDGLRVSGADVLRGLSTKKSMPNLTALSLDSCSLADSDLIHLCDGLKVSLKICMLKLSNNRLTDHAVDSMCAALLQHDRHPLTIVDFTHNNIGDDGAKSLAKLYNTKTSYITSLNSINLSHNILGKAGLISLLTCFSDGSPLVSLFLQNQKSPISEVDMDDVCSTVSSVLDLKKQRTQQSGQAASRTREIPKVSINLMGCGPQCEKLRQIDCASILTDYRLMHHPFLILHHCLSIAAALLHSKSDIATMSMDDWNLVTGGLKDKGVPSWLHVESKRHLAAYMTNLPTTVTERRLIGILENEAESNVDEVILIKDPMTRQVNGIGYVLFLDQKSLTRAIEYFTDGHAKIYGKAFTISEIRVNVTQTVPPSSLILTELGDRQRRDTERRQSHLCNLEMIRQSTEASWKRHADRAANPAYADGRIW